MSKDGGPQTVNPRACSPELLSYWGHAKNFSASCAVTSNDDWFPHTLADGGGKSRALRVGGKNCQNDLEWPFECGLGPFLYRTG